MSNGVGLTVINHRIQVEYSDLIDARDEGNYYIHQSQIPQHDSNRAGAAAKQRTQVILLVVEVCDAMYKDAVHD